MSPGLLPAYFPPNVITRNIRPELLCWNPFQLCTLQGMEIVFTECVRLKPTAH